MGNIEIKFKRLHDNAVLPAYANPGDAGLDLTAVSVKKVHENGVAYVEYGTGLAMELPPGYVGLLFPRSSISKKDLILANCVGVVEGTYRGEVLARFKPTSVAYEPAYYNAGDRVVQLVIVPIPVCRVGWADELSDTQRGTGGFGSSGQ